MSTRESREEARVRAVAAGIESAMRQRSAALGERMDIDEIEGELEEKLGRIVSLESYTGDMSLHMSHEEFKRVLANFIVRGTATVSELVTHHNGREIRLVCDDAPVRFTVFLDGHVEYS